MNRLAGIVGGLILLGFALVGVWYLVTFLWAGDDPVAEVQACSPVPVLKPVVLQCPVPEPLIVIEQVTCPVFPVLDQLYVSQREVLRNPPEDDRGSFVSWIGNMVRFGYKW